MARLLQYLYFCRFPLLVAIALAALGPVSVWAAPTLLANLFHLSFNGIVLVSWLAFFTAWVVLIALEIILRGAPYRFGVPALRIPAWLRRFRVPLFALVGLPVAAVAVGRSGGPLGARLGAAALGAFLAGLTLLLAASLQALLRARGTRPSDVVPAAPTLAFLPALRRGGGDAGPPSSPAAGGPDAGYGSLRHLGLATSHLVATVFLAITSAAYAAGYWAGYPCLRPGCGGPPALAYVLLVLLLGAWALPGLSFWLDRFRVPVLLLLVLASFLSSQACNTDHYYRIVRAPTAPGPPARPAPPRAFRPLLPEAAYEAAEERQASQAPPAPPERPIVVVAASGGGITAALWTARVVTALQAEVGDDFARSIRLVSSVSGGSVGAVYYLDRFTPAGPPDAAARSDLLAAAGESSLDAAVWGIAYPDLWRSLAGVLLRDPALDRGWALERAWRSRLAGKDVKLSDWRDRVARGWLPAAVLNATTVETGQRFLLTPLGLQTGGDARRFDSTYRGYDLPVVTAARLSATFPWVSPITRAQLPDGAGACPALHVADGGYYDNFGVLTVVDWLRVLERTNGDELRRRGVLLVLIQAFPTRDGELDCDDTRGWLYATLGPIVTLLNVRASSQAVRNTLDLDLLAQLWRGQGIALDSVPFVLRRRSPLSWKLTPDERQGVLDGMDEEGNRAGLVRVKALFERGVTGPPGP
jgi:hypothetical protein